jgi:hypothetical protein
MIDELIVYEKRDRISYFFLLKLLANHKNML